MIDRPDIDRMRDLGMTPQSKIRGLTLKHPLKKVAERYLPKELIYRRKQGFSSPISGLLTPAALDHLIAQLNGAPAPPPYDGVAGCYVELGDDMVGRIDVNFLTYDTPVAKFVPPDISMVNDKKQWGAERRARWFGHDITG